MVKTYVLNTNKLMDKKVFDTYFKNVSESRKKKINRYKFEKDKTLSLGAAILLDSGLEEFGKREKDIEITYNKYNKPYFQKYEDIKFSISHSEEYVICCFSDKEVGVDIEKIRNHNIEIAERFFCKSEYDYIKMFTGYEQNKAFSRVWTIKESYVKKIGIGLYLPFNKFEIKSFENIVIHEDEKENKCFFKEFNQIEGYAIAICDDNNNFESIINVEI